MHRNSKIIFVLTILMESIRISCLISAEFNDFTLSRNIFERPSVNRDFAPSIDLQVSVHLNRTSVEIDGNEIYLHKRNLTNGIFDYLDYVTGVHFVLLHQTTFKVLFKELFYTAQPSADKYLLRRLLNVHDGRIAVLIGSSNFTFWFRSEAKDFFYDSGTLLGPEVALGESWTLIFRKGFSKWKDFELDADYWEETLYKKDDLVKKMETLNKNRRKKQLKSKKRFLYAISPLYENEHNKSESLVSDDKKPNEKSSKERILGKYKILYEGISTIKNFVASQASPFTFTVNIQSQPEERCSWHANQLLKDLANFCSLYDGYKPFCQCEDRVPLLPKFGPSQNTEYEVIPVAIVTAKRLPQVLRQVRQIRAGAGGGAVPIWICVDGFNPEAKHLARLLDIHVIFHDNKYAKGTRDRVNEHVGWSLRKTLELNRNANYFIVLEDDLDLAPDFMRYFQQIAWLMDIDKTLMIANAYNYNAYPHTATDSSKIHIVQSYPYYGWMVGRENAVKMVRKWVTPEEKADWDLFSHYYHVNNSHIIIPEVPRTKHIGGGGVHVSGYVQETTYNVRPLNKKANVDLNLMRHWAKAYALDLMKYALSATVLKITQNPCSHPPLSTEKPGGKYVLYLNLTGDADEASSYSTIAQCLGFYEENMMEQLDGAFMRKYFYNEILMIACPVSPYCHIEENSPLIYSPSEKAIEDANEFPFVHMHSEVEIWRRVEPTNFLEEITLKNSYGFIVNIDE